MMGGGGLLGVMPWILLMPESAYTVQEILDALEEYAIGMSPLCSNKRNNMKASLQALSKIYNFW